jgi:hypothetical protein
MRNLSLLFLLIFSGAASLSFIDAPTAEQCKKFHTGTFYVKGQPDVTIVRDEKFQTETGTDGKYAKMSVTWTDDCTYELRLVKTNDKANKKAWKKQGMLTVTITECNENSYKFSAMTKGYPDPVLGTIARKEEK